MSILCKCDKDDGYKVTADQRPGSPQRIPMSSLRVCVAINSSPPSAPDSKVHGADMGPTWLRQDPGGPHVDPMNLAIWGIICNMRQWTGPALVQKMNYLNQHRLIVNWTLMNQLQLTFNQNARFPSWKCISKCQNRQFGSDLSISGWQFQFAFTDGYEMTQHSF